MVGSYALGIYPRSKRLIEATRTNSPKLDLLIKEEKDKYIKLEEKVNLTYIADPMLNWDDMFRPFSKVKGIILGPLNRFFETNFFYRKLIINGELMDYGKIVYNNIIVIKGKSCVSIPDPYTFAELNENRYYKSYEDYIFAIASMLNEEAKTLANEGVEFIQLEAPSIAYNSDKLDERFNIIKEAIERVKHGVRSKVYVHLYFGKISKILDRLLDIKVDGLSIDLVNNKIEELYTDFDDKGLGLGIIDTTNTRMEDPKISNIIEKALDKIKPKEAYICTNTDLEFLPYTFAIRKIYRLVRIAKRIKYGC